jgi:hypothetical protein
VCVCVCVCVCVSGNPELSTSSSLKALVDSALAQVLFKTKSFSKKIFF